jgi:CRP/FNR family transcriptional regulator, cyclic AMP receptor protein
MEPGRLEQKIDFLNRIEPFQRLNHTQLAELATHFHLRRYKNRETIFHQGDSSPDVLVIHCGMARIFTINEFGTETSLRLFGEGDMIGELSATDGEPRSATAQAIGPCQVMIMDHRNFRSCLDSMPELSLAMIRFLSGKLRWTTHFSHTLAQYDTAGRLLHLLVEYRDKFGKVIAPGKIYELHLALNQAELASMVGARREWINRLLQQWRKEGLITYGRGIITILDLKALIRERDRRLTTF